MSPIAYMLLGVFLIGFYFAPGETFIFCPKYKCLHDIDLSLINGTWRHDAEAVGFFHLFPLINCKYAQFIFNNNNSMNASFHSGVGDIDIVQKAQLVRENGELKLYRQYDGFQTTSTFCCLNATEKYFIEYNCINTWLGAKATGVVYAREASKQGSKSIASDWLESNGFHSRAFKVVDQSRCTK